MDLDGFVVGSVDCGGKRGVLIDLAVILNADGDLIKSLLISQEFTSDKVLVKIRHLF